MTLEKRFQRHKTASKKSNSLVYRTIREDPLGIENYYIELIEYFPCNNKDELEKREGLYQLNMDFKLNVRIAGRKFEEYQLTNQYKNYQKEYHKTHYIINREKRLNYQKIYDMKKKN